MLGEDVEFEATGHIKIARSEADMAELERYADMAREHGLELTLLGANAVRDELPWLGPNVVGASLSPTDGQANPRVVGPAYARLARKLGAEIREFAPVHRAVATGAGFETEAEGVLRDEPLARQRGGRRGRGRGDLVRRARPGVAADAQHGGH